MNPENERMMREIRWQELESKVEAIADQIEEKVDPGIKNAVVGLLANEVNTTASCEGHEDRGTHAPYIDVEAQDLSELLRARDANPDNDEILDQIKLKNAEEGAKLQALVSEFYEGREVSTDAKLEIWKYDLGINRLQSRGAIEQEGVLPEVMVKNLKAYQEEMSAFTEFLKRRFFK